MAPARTLSLALVAVLLGPGACTPIDPPDEPPSSVEPVAVETPAAPAEARIPAKGLPWHWSFREPDPVPPARVATDEATFEVRYHAMSTGATAVRLDTQGKLAWETALYGAGPIGHSKYRNRVQVELSGGGLVVYGWESGGAYVEVLDQQTGEQIDHTPVDMELVNLPWAWKGDEREWKPQRPITFSVGDGKEARLADDGKHARLLVDGAPLVELPQPEGELAAGAGVVHGGVIYFVHASAIATGATLYAIDADRGEIRWRLPLIGAGPVAHSEYFNSLQIAMHGDHIVVYGNEASGRYVEVVDPAGKTIVNKLWDGA